LEPATNYFFALKVVDAAGNRSPMSDGVTVTTAVREKRHEPVGIGAHEQSSD
jgi:hypothetical protein